MNTRSDTKLLARRAREGYAHADSVKLLAELRAAHTGDNLTHALAYNGFISPKGI